MRVLVTGGAGFLGSHLCESLLVDFHEVCAIDDMFRGRKKNLESCKSSAAEIGVPFHLVMKDGAAPESYETALKRLNGSVDVVYHLAAINGTRWFNERPDLVARVNLSTLQTALDFAVTNGARFVFTSSPEAFGDQHEMPIASNSDSQFRSSAIHQRHSYGASKYLGELLIQHAVKTHSLDARIVRPFNSYGPRLPGDSHGQVVSMMLERCLAEEPIEIHGAGEQTRCFTWVEDMIRGIRSAGELDQGLDGSNLTGRAFNLGSTEETSVRKLAELCRTVTGTEISPIEVEGHPGDSKRRVPDCTEARDALGWEAKLPILDGIQRTWAWMKARHEA